MGSLSLKNITSYSVILIENGISDIFIVQSTLFNGKKFYKSTNTPNLFIFWRSTSNAWELGSGIGVGDQAIGNTQYPWEADWSSLNIVVEKININNNKISIKPQNIIVSSGVITPPGVNPSGKYLLQNSLVNGKPWYSRPGGQVPIAQDAILRMIYTNQGWIIQYNLNNWFLLTSATNVSNNPWEATWPNNMQVSLGSGGKLSSRDLLKTLSNQIDPIIENLTANDNTLKLFSTEQPNGICCQGANSTTPINPVYTRNTNCWAKNIDTSPISIWNNGGGYPEPEHAGGSGGTGLLITRKHIILAHHFRMKVGSKLIFVDMNNNTYVRTLQNVERIIRRANFTDIVIGVLDSDLPSSVSHMKILDPHIANKFAIELRTKRIPVFLMNVERKVFVGELINQSGFQFRISNDPTNPSKRREFYPFNSNFGYAMNFGDSGNTCSIVYNNKLIHVFHFMFPNFGSEAYPYINEINQAINSLGNPNNYTVELESFNL